MNNKSIHFGMDNKDVRDFISTNINKVYNKLASIKLKPASNNGNHPIDITIENESNKVDYHNERLNVYNELNALITIMRMSGWKDFDVGGQFKERQKRKTMEELNMDLVELLFKSITTTDGSTRLLNILTIITIVIGATKSFFELIIKIFIWIRNLVVNRLIPINRIMFNRIELNTIFSNSFYHNKNKEFKLSSTPETTIIIKKRKLFFFYVITDILSLDNENRIETTEINEKTDQFVFNYVLSEKFLLTLKNNINNKILVKTKLTSVGYNKNNTVELVEDITKKIKKNRFIFFPLTLKKTNLINDKANELMNNSSSRERIENKIKNQNPDLFKRDEN